MSTATEFFRWWITDERTGKRRLTRFAMTRAQAPRAAQRARAGCTWIEDEYSLTVDETSDWARGSGISDIALTMCQAAKQA